ncbi:MAG TPA: M56 family metallopeptidase [Longimicrobiaceae bacterium]|nr:M56 family metallopeptidase [Longimicrobiaceae bacterium]
MIELLWLASALADGAWLDALLRAALRGSVLLLAAGAATLLLRGAPAAARHLVWALAFAGLLALPLLPRLLPPVEVPLPAVGHALLEWAPLDAHLWEVPFTVEVAPHPEVYTVVATPSAEERVVLAPAVDAALLDLPPVDGAPPALPPVVLAPIVPPPGDLAHVLRPAGVHRAELGFGWGVLLLGGWTLGALLVLGFLARGVLGLRRVERGAEWVTDGPLLDLLDELRARTGVERRVVLLRGGPAAMPATWGVLRPRILLPASADAWPEERARAVLLHELAHVRRGDWATQMIAETACALYWFNPLVWIAAHRLREEGEHACDDQVLRAGSRPSEYAGHLLEVARTLQAGRAAQAASVAMARPAQVRGRLLAVLADDRRRGPVPHGFALPALLCAAGAVAVLSALTPAWAAPAATAAPEPALAELIATAPETVVVQPSFAPLAREVVVVPQEAPRCPTGSGSSRHDEVSDGRRETEWHNQRGCGGRVESTGEVEIDGADVVRLEPGGRFSIELYDRGDRRSAEVLSAAGGGVRRTFTVNGRTREWDENARRWMAGALAEYLQAIEPPAPPAPPARPARPARPAASARPATPAAPRAPAAPQVRRTPRTPPVEPAPPTPAAPPAPEPPVR